MERDYVRARLGKIGNDAIDRFDHEMNVDGYIDMRPDCRANHGPHCQIRDIMIVHHIEMDHVGASLDDVADFVAQLGKIGGKNTGCNAILGHGNIKIDFRKFYFIPVD